MGLRTKPHRRSRRAGVNETGVKQRDEHSQQQDDRCIAAASNSGKHTVCISRWEPPRCIVGVVSQQECVSLPGRRDLTVRAKSPGMRRFEILMHFGSRGVLWGMVSPAGVVPVRCPDDCARGTDAHAHTRTHTSDLW